jgi:hypothetical protein
MNIVVLTAARPFASDVANELQRHLVNNLRRHGVNSEAIRIPTAADSPEHLIDNMVMCRALQLANVDRVIALRFPAYLVAHPSKVCWVIHPWHEADRAADSSCIPNTPRGHEIRRIIQHSDSECLGQARKLFAGSSLISEQLKVRNGLNSEVLTPPLLSSDVSWTATIKKLLS